RPYMPPTEATVGSGGIYRRLTARPLDGFHAAIEAQYLTPTNSALKEIVVGLPVDDDCNGNGIPDAVEIANGSAADCNHNGIPDSCEIAGGAVADANHNGIPDSCEAAVDDDCNRNGISDAFELSLGIGDFNGNGILDECENGIQIKSLPITRGLNAHFYRAQGLRVRGASANSFEVEYQGNLEESNSVKGPWSLVP
ncbi:MAG TPA: hypothetical protein VHH73_19590, partial [Verrucomicrobiae bacterium]|nr:hypothetical protein [Verrucomicrobiae bacterium]